MTELVAAAERFWWIIPIVLVAVGYKLVLRTFGVVIIPEDQVGIVTKRWGMTTLPDGALIALNGESGIQADTLAPGLHLWLWPWQFSVRQTDFVLVPQGKIGVVEARDGKPLPGGRVLAKQVACDAFQNARAFLTGGGERGTQIAVIPPGTYRINKQLFTVAPHDAVEIEDNAVGVVTTLEGTPLPTGDIAGAEVSGHSMFQNGQAFIEAGGTKGLQTQVLLAGRYFINPRFAVVEEKPLTDVPIAHAGVVIAYVGEIGVDVSGEKFKHGNLVRKGQRGVWVDPLDPGRYPINPYTHKVEVVPTQNVVLNWATGKTEAHQLDKNLSTITVRSSDGFTFNLDVSQIIHIPRNDAPYVIARMGSVANLVTQVLEPTIGNYFRNAAQGSDVIEFLRSRRERQTDAKAAIQAALNDYNVAAVDTLIGDITPPPSLMATLTDRKIAEQAKMTFATQQIAEVARKELEQAKAVAATQAKVVDSERSVAIADFAAQAKVKQAEGDAKSKRINAEADVIRRKTEAMSREQFALVQIAQALASAHQPLVPQIVAGGEQGGGSLVNLLLANALKAGSVAVAPPTAEGT